MNGHHDYRNSPEWRRAVWVAVVLGLLALAAFVVLGCDGSSPTEPSRPRTVCPQLDSELSCALVTPYGTATVYTLGNPTDFGRMHATIEAAYADAEAQLGHRDLSKLGSLDGMRVMVHRDLPCRINAACWQPPDVAVGDVMNLQSGNENMRHELKHRFAYAMYGRGPCMELQDHRPGFDLKCNAR